MRTALMQATCRRVTSRSAVTVPDARPPNLSPPAGLTVTQILFTVHGHTHSSSDTTLTGLTARTLAICHSEYKVSAVSVAGALSSGKN